jgi:hypothetical protein
MDFDALVSIDGRAVQGASTIATRLYHPIMQGTDLMLGWAVSIPLEKDATALNAFNNEIGAQFQVGVATDVPMLGRWTIATDIMKSPVQGSAWLIGQNVWFQKNFLYNLTDQVKIGLTWTALSVNLNQGTRSILISPTIFPVIGATINL